MKKGLRLNWSLVGFFTNNSETSPDEEGIKTSGLTSKSSLAKFGDKP